MSAKENADNLMAAAMKAGITDPKELSNFMAQMQVESGGYSRMSENLGYSGSRLLEVFPGRNGLHTLSEANQIAAGGPEAIANKIYGGDYGEDKLGNTQPGDGWKYHGRGYVQLTGHDNYQRLGKELGIDLVNHPELAEDKDVAASIAIQYWKDRVQTIGKETDVRGATYGINGGYNGLDAREGAAQAWESALKEGYKPGGPEPIPGGSAGHAMSKEKAEQVQTLLNAHGYVDSHGQPLVVDGHPGKETKAAIERFQTDHQLKPDGVVGPATLKALQQAPQQNHAQPTTGAAITAPATTPPHDAPHLAGTLRQGATGTAVETLQASLREQGYNGMDGKALGADGHFGPQTTQAVQAFQRAHGLDADGVAGPKTMQVLDGNARQAAAPSLADASHPANGMYRQALDGVQRLDAQHGREPGPHTNNIAGSLTSVAVNSGMTSIDHVVLSSDASKAYAMQGAANSPFKQHAEVSVVQAAQTPLAQSSAEALAASDQTRQHVPAAQAQTAVHHQEAQQPLPPRM